MPFSLRTSPIGTIYYQMMKKHLLPWLVKARITADQITMAGAAIAALTPFGFFLHPAAGLALIILSGMADSLDGPMARRQNQASPFGSFLDSSLDRLSDFFYLLGFWVLFWDKQGFMAATVLFFLCLLLTLMISYVKARAEALGTPCNVGLMERGARIVFLSTWAVVAITLSPTNQTLALWSGLGAYFVLVLATLLQRVRHIRDRMRASL